MLFSTYRSFLPDLSFLSSDCFHPSQKLQALFAKNIWNNLLQPVGGKSSWNQFSNLKCPTREHPFIATSKNSQESGVDFEEDEDDLYDDDDDESEEKPFQRKRLVRRRKKFTKRSPKNFDSKGQNDNTCDLLN